MLLMMTMFAGVAAPVLTGDWIRHNDYPTSALQRGEEGAVEYRVVVSPEGKPENCEVLAITGEEKFGRLTCSLLMRRARFSPATDEAGQPAYGVFHSINNFWLPKGTKSKYPMRLTPDLSLAVESLPADVPSPAKAAVHIVVDEGGAVQTCSVPSSELHQTLASVACAQIPKLWEEAPVKNAAGLAIPYVRTVTVSFEAERR
ncbi:TonB family protein [Sphingomonas sp. LY54]|uniref:TonB family protein n=1 Tax=Sphingomonas sp. LY54 TaxID=3095343 RepID=UPI002D773FEB|nr:TonB family protein [Sphingomonas sp. LY54]WRP28471.1 TonB family protein [Sphingomonas sp. LY54]